MGSTIDFSSALKLVLDYLAEHYSDGEWQIVRTDETDSFRISSAGNPQPSTKSTHEGLPKNMYSELKKRAAKQPDNRIIRIRFEKKDTNNSTSAISHVIALPLFKRKNQPYGFICGVFHCHKALNREGDGKLLSLISELLNGLLHSETFAESQIRRAERFEAQALTDAMTTLFNRAGWDQLLQKEEQRCERQDKPCAIIIIDLDDLKHVNDTQGHFVGDQLIKRAAQALLQASRKEDVVARLGGDEFGILAINCDERSSTRLLWRLRNCLEKEKINASIGIASRQSAESVSDVFRRADEAMYQEKRRKRRLSREKALSEFLG